MKAVFLFPSLAGRAGVFICAEGATSFLHCRRRRHFICARSAQPHSLSGTSFAREAQLHSFIAAAGGTSFARAARNFIPPPRA
jgi:hypothetical protein